MGKYGIMAAIGFTLAVIGTQFTSCDNFSDTALFNEFSSNCLDDSEASPCYPVDVSLLEIGTSNTQVSVGANDSAVYISGQCNEGNFPDNRIIWELRRGQEVVRTSVEVNVVERCERGLFDVYVPLPYLGLAGQNHTLKIEIIGLDKEGTQHVNPSGQVTINLFPQ